MARQAGHSTMPSVVACPPDRPRLWLITRRSVWYRSRRALPCLAPAWWGWVPCVAARGTDPERNRTAGGAILAPPVRFHGYPSVHPPANQTPDPRTAAVFLCHRCGNCRLADPYTGGRSDVAKFRFQASEHPSFTSNTSSLLGHRAFHNQHHRHEHEHHNCQHPEHIEIGKGGSLLVTQVLECLQG